MSKIFVEDTEMRDIADAIREKNGTENTYKPSEMPQAIKDIENSRGVDYMPYVDRISFTSALSEITDDIYLDLSRATSLAYTAYNFPFNFKKLTIKISNLLTNFQRAFVASTPFQNEALKEIEIIGDTSNVTNFNTAFSGRYNLERIIGVIDFSSSKINDIVMNCPHLKEFTPKANTIKVSMPIGNSPDLTLETIQFIIDGLADLTGTDSQVLTLHATVKGKLTQDQIAQITNKNWTLA